MKRRQPLTHPLSGIRTRSATPGGQSPAQSVWSGIELTPEQIDQLRAAIGNPVVIDVEVAA